MNLTECKGDKIVLFALYLSNVIGFPTASLYGHQMITMLSEACLLPMNALVEYVCPVWIGVHTFIFVYFSVFTRGFAVFYRHGRDVAGVACVLLCRRQNIHCSRVLPQQYPSCSTCHTLSLLKLELYVIFVLPFCDVGFYWYSFSFKEVVKNASRHIILP
jgi:hypothetical protein